MCVSVWFVLSGQVLLENGWIDLYQFNCNEVANSTVPQNMDFLKAS